MSKFKVIRTDGTTGKQTQCGAAVKTPAKAYDLLGRMKAQQTRGDSNSFKIDKA